MKSVTFLACLLLSVLLSGTAEAKGSRHSAEKGSRHSAGKGWRHSAEKGWRHSAEKWGRQSGERHNRPHLPINETALFMAADTDNSTCLSLEELQNSRIGHMLPRWVAPKVLSHYDGNTDGCLDLDEFKVLLADFKASDPHRLYRSHARELIVDAAAIFEKADKLDLAQSDCLSRVEFQAAIMMLGGGYLPLSFVDILLAEYAADDTCLSRAKYDTFVADFRRLRRDDIFNRADGDDLGCLSAMEFQHAAQDAIDRRVDPLAVLAFFALDDANSNGCIEEAEFKAFMDRFEI